MTKGTHLLRGALLALLALAVISGGSLAAGDLFDDDYSDCPHKTRLRDGQISDLSVTRDSEDEDEVNVSWGATDPDTWGLGPNAYNTSLVVILDDGTTTQTETLSLAKRKITFDGVDTGTKVTVQMAIVVDTADGDYLISDILDKSINQSLTEPSFMTTIKRVTIAAADGPPPVLEDAEDTMGVLYYVGYNENFGNYQMAGLTTRPGTARLRIGLAHSDQETGDDRGDVDFDAYIMRISDEDGDVIPEGDDVATIVSNYGNYAATEEPVTRLYLATATSFTNKISNVRINDDGTVQASIHASQNPQLPNVGDGGTFARSGITPGGDEGIGLSFVRPATAGTTADLTTGGSGVVNALFAALPDEHRDYPIDILASDTTYTFTAWAINEDNEVISPVASLKVRPINENVTGVTLTDYLGANPAGTVTITEFTVLK